MATTLPHSLISISGGGTSSSASDLFKSRSNFVNGVPFNTFVRTRLSTTAKRDLTTVAIWKGIGEGIGKGIGKGLGKGFGKGKGKEKEKKKPEQSLTPVVTDPNAKGGFLRRLSEFQPLKEKPKPVSLNFEKPLLELEKKINEVRKMAEQTGLDFTDQILLLQSKYDKALKDLYTNLTPIQRVYIARHPQRPTFLDHVFNMTDKFIELHGDRAGYDDPAIVTGLGKIDGRTYMFIGQQKGRNSKENIKRNFGMPTPHGYRKALRMMRYADEHKFPIITFVDTPGAYADLKSEELGQGEAIAYNLKAMFGLKVPVVSIVIGEGGSGGALGIACGNKLLMLENAVFYVASPEACAAILFKSAAAAPLAAARLKITAPELCRMKIADGIIPEPLGGAHVDPAWTSQQIKIAVTKAMDELLKMDTPQLLHDRWLKFRNVGKYKTIEPEQMSLITQKKELLTGIKQKPFVQKEISKAKEISEKFGAAELADVKRKVEALNADIVSAQANGDGDLEKELKEKLKKVEVEMKMAIRTSLLGEKKAVRIARVLSKYLSDGKKKIEELKVEISNARTKGNRDSEKKLQEELATFEAEMKLKQVKVLNSSLLDDKKIGRVSKALVIDLPEAQKKIKALKADIASARAGRNGDLEKQLQEKLMKMEEESKLKKLQVLKSTLRGFNKVRETSNSLVSDPSDVTEKIEALKALKADLASARTNGDGDLEQKLEEKLLKMATEMNLIKSQMHKSSLMNVEKVRKTPDVELTEEMKTLDQRIKKKLAEVKASSAVGEKHDKLRMELEEANGSSGGSDGTLKSEALNENGSTYDDGSAVGINIGANQEHS